MKKLSLAIISLCARHLSAENIAVAYPVVEVGRSIDVVVSYEYPFTNRPSDTDLARWFCIAEDGLAGLWGMICSNGVPLYRVPAHHAYGAGMNAAPDTGRCLRADISLPVSATPSIPGQYELRMKFIDPMPGGSRKLLIPADWWRSVVPINFNVVAEGMPATARPRPWIEYEQEPALYADFRTLLLNAPPYRQSDWLARKIGLEMRLRLFADVTVPENLRIDAVREDRARRGTINLLPGWETLLFSNNLPRSIRGRAAILLGQMRGNEVLIKQCREKFWKDLNDPESALMRFCLIEGLGIDHPLLAAVNPKPGEDPSDPVKYLQLKFLWSQRRLLEAQAFATKLTNSTSSIPFEFLREKRTMVRLHGDTLDVPEDYTIGLEATKIIERVPAILERMKQEAEARARMIEEERRKQPSSRHAAPP